MTERQTDFKDPQKLAKALLENDEQAWGYFYEHTRKKLIRFVCQKFIQLPKFWDCDSLFQEFLTQKIFPRLDYFFEKVYQLI